jgi:hypothetical protein
MNNPIIPEEIRRISRERALEFHRRSKKLQPENIEPGQVWSTHSQIRLADEVVFETDDPRIIVILDASLKPAKQLVAAPISVFVSMASEFDLICRRDESPLGFDFIAEVWNETPMLREHLRDYVGTLGDKLKSALLDLYGYHLADEQLPTSMLTLVGPQLIGEQDPRFVFQEAEVGAAAYLARAATAALSMELASEESIPVQNRVRERRRFITLPSFGRLSDVLHQPAIAYAAGLDAEKTWVVPVSEGEDYLTLELLSSRSSPYDVYLVAHEISPSLIGRSCIVTITTVGREFQSEPSELQAGREIRVGEGYPFRPDQVQSIAIDIQ